MEETAEWQLTCKIRAEDYPSVEAAILAGHSYQVPEIVAVPATHGFAPYENWVAEVTRR